ncbi:hypothetical protein C8Q73DRAFT_713292 [Cubamyces lactineus]|nr:hypothetical protein C8Q73DRAFT_713292 [Cubamyces lactineus]
MSQASATKNIVVIGAGVVGLTTALKIQEKGGYRVTIVADTFPTDAKTIKYTSLWAGAHHVSHAAEDAKQMEYPIKCRISGILGFFGRRCGILG